jgi:hypothetical protein
MTVAPKVVILAGGRGSRLSEETDTKPKPMVEIGDYPIIWHIMKIYSRLTFALGGNGLASLTSGWGDPESWGTWSVAKRAVLRVRPKSKDGLPLHAELKFLPFIGPAHPQIDVVCRARGKEIARWNCPSAEWQIRTFTISSDLIGSDGIVDLEFLISHPRLPAELGISADTRQLGIGVESLAMPTLWFSPVALPRKSLLAKR